MFSAKRPATRSATLARRQLRVFDQRSGLSRDNVALCAGPLGVGGGMRVIDMGCGGGAGTVALAHAVGAGGLVWGVDADEALVAAASARAKLPQLRWVCSDAAHIDAASASWDLCWIDRVLAHLESPASLLAEAARLLRPGGRLFSCELDYAGISLIGDLRSADRATLTAALDAYRETIPAPTVAQQLPAMLTHVLPGARVHRQRCVFALPTRRAVFDALAVPLWLRLQAAPDRQRLALLRAAADALARTARGPDFALTLPVQWTLAWRARDG